MGEKERKKDGKKERIRRWDIFAKMKGNKKEERKKKGKKIEKGKLSKKWRKEEREEEGKILNSEQKDRNKYEGKNWKNIKLKRHHFLKEIK